MRKKARGEFGRRTNQLFSCEKLDRTSSYMLFFDFLDFFFIGEVRRAVVYHEVA